MLEVVSGTCRFKGNCEYSLYFNTHTCNCNLVHFALLKVGQRGKSVLGLCGMQLAMGRQHKRQCGLRVGIGLSVRKVQPQATTR